MGNYWPSYFMSQQRYKAIDKDFDKYEPVQIECVNCHKMFTWLKSKERIYFGGCRKPCLCGLCKVEEPYISYLSTCESYNETPVKRGNHNQHRAKLYKKFKEDWDYYYS